MSQDAVQELMAQVLRIDVGLLQEDSAIGQTPGWNSLSHMQLIAAIEERWPIRLSGDEIAEMRDLASIRLVLECNGVR